MNENTNVQIITLFPLADSMPPQLINNVSVTAKICRERHIGLNENTLRFLCKTGQIPCIKVGNKTLINWNVLMDYLAKGGVRTEQSESEAPVPTSTAGGVRRSRPRGLGVVSAPPPVRTGGSYFGKEIKYGKCADTQKQRPHKGVGRI